MTSLKLNERFDDTAYDEAWSNFKTMLAQGIVHFQYYKMDGTLREAHGTLQDLMIPERDVPKTPGSGTKDAKFTNYYDLIAGGWRTFINENLIQFQWSGKTFMIARPDLIEKYRK